MTGPLRRHLAVVNPAAGGGACGRLAPAALERLSQAGLKVEAVATGAPGDAIRLAREGVRAGHRSVVAVGGDGTACEVVNGLMAALADGAVAAPERLALGVLPLGSGNSFLRDFGDGRLATAVAALAEGRARPLDVVRLEHADGALHFVNLASLGFVAAVGALRNRRLARLGQLGYVLGVLVEVARLRRWSLPAAVDGGPLDRDPVTFLAFCNSRFTGGAMLMAPAAATDDGLLDLVRVGPLSRRALLAAFPRIYAGTHASHPAVTMSRARAVDLDLPGPLDVLVDGEVLRLHPRRLGVLPGALDVWT